MDSNGTRHHLLLGMHDWMGRGPGDAVGRVSYDATREQLTLRSEPFRFPQRRGDRRPSLSDRRGADLDGFENVYWIDATRRSIQVRSAGSGASSRFWEPDIGVAAPTAHAGGFGPRPDVGSRPPARALPLSGLAVTEDHYLAVGTLDPTGLLVFDLHAPGPPRQELWPDTVAFQPFDLCARSGGGVFVLDRSNRRLWELDRRFLVVSQRDGQDAAERPDFTAKPETPSPAPEPRPAWSAHRRIELDDATPLGGDPIAIETGPPGQVLVLDGNEASPPSAVRLLAPGTATGPTGRLEERAPDPDSADFEVVAHDMALVAAGPDGATDGRLGTLYVADREGNQAFAFALRLVAGELDATLVHDYFPMRLFGGKALLAPPAGQESPMYDFGDGWVPLVRQSRPRFATSATVPLKVFDGRLPGTAWHRLVIDGRIPPETSVVVESRAVDDERELATAPWLREPALVYQRHGGSELPFTTRPEGQETWELLFQQARGRWLQLRLTLTGDGRTTPRLRALRAYYPRFSYLEHYLPKVYREDAPSASFLDRFLANLEGLHTAIEDRIAASHALFDPRTAPAETLEWLLSWFDLAADPTWPEERRRLFLAHAAEFFTLRGTIPGIQLALRLALDPCDDEQLFSPVATRRHTSRIVEHYRTRRIPAVVLGDASQLSGPRVVPQAPRWNPAQGRETLIDRWRASVGDPTAGFPLTDPSEHWRGFMRGVVGVESANAFDTRLWTSFLSSRYGRIESLDAAYGVVGAVGHDSFADVAFPDELPADGPALLDWYHFLALVLPAHRTAHRFTVLLPMPANDDERRGPEERRAIAQRVVDLQKPVDTTFEVKFFLSAFRAGAARLGDDTILDLGSRDPRLRPPVVLGHEYVGEGHLGGIPPPTGDHAGRHPLHR